MWWLAQHGGVAVSDHVATHPHEIRGNLTFDGEDDRPYWAMRSLFRDLDGDFAHEVEIDGEEWHVQLSYDQSGVAPRPQDDVEKLYEYRLKAEGHGHRSISAKLQPRFETMHKFDTSADEVERDSTGARVEIQSVPDDLGPAVNWRINPAVNIEHDEVASLLPRLIKAVADSVGHRWSTLFFAGRPHRYSSVWEYERYVRLRRDAGRKLIDPSGTFSRIRELLADQKGTKMDISIDNTGKNRDTVGYNHQYRLNDYAASQLAPVGNQRGKQLKHYHPEFVNGDESDPLAHPKFGVLFKKSWSKSSVPWRELDDLARELEETLVNCLSWADLPVKAGSPTFVADDHFANVESDIEVAWHDDPTPRIESRQDSLFVQKLTELTDSGEAVVEQLVADGGEARYDDLANEADTSVSTLYRALETLDELVESDNGTVRFLSERIQQQFEGIFSRVKRTVSAAAEAAGRVLDMNPKRIEEQGSAFASWLNEYAVDVIEAGEQVKLKIGAMLSRFRFRSRRSGSVRSCSVRKRARMSVC